MAEAWLRRLDGAAGIQLAVRKSDRLVLSLWGGADPFRRIAITNNSLFPILSATKGIASLVLLHLHHRGYFRWDDRVAAHWPAFGKYGKGSATIGQVLSHRLGLPHLTADWRRWPDRDYMTQLVEDARPAWLPGTRYGYHGGSWGIVVDELVRRWTRSETGEVLRNSFASLDGVDNCYIGLPRRRYSDVARLLYLEPQQRATAPPLGPIGPDEEYNSYTILKSCQSSGGCVASAESLAALYSLIANEGTSNGRTFWTPEKQRLATIARNDPSTEHPAARPTASFAWGYGFMVHPSRHVFGSEPVSAYVAGHPGASGAIGYADPRHRLSVAFTINGVGGQQVYKRYGQLGDLLRSAVAASGE